MLDLIAAALAGILIGGIVNLLADDLPLRRRPQFPPRYPDGTPRPPQAWLGLLAFVTGTRTAPTGARLSWRYPAAELGTALLFVLTLLANRDDPAMTNAQQLFWLAYMAIFALITVIDIEHKLILFVVIIPSSILAIVDALLTPVTNYGPSLSETLVGGGVGFAVSFLLYLGGFLFIYVSGQVRGHSTDEVAFGYGDVLMFTLSGLILGIRPLLFAMFITVMAGALGALAYFIGRSLAGGRYRLFTALPYGPYIVFGTIMMMLYSSEVLRFSGITR